MSNSLRPHGLKPARVLCPWDFPGKNTGVVAISQSRGSSRPGAQTCISCVSCVGRWVFATSATWEAPFNVNLTAKGSGVKDNLVNLKHTYRKGISETSLAVQWLTPCASKAGGVDMTPGQGTEIPHGIRHGHRSKKKQKNKRKGFRLPTPHIASLSFEHCDILFIHHGFNFLHRTFFLTPSGNVFS